MKRKFIYPLLVIIVTVGFYYIEKKIDVTNTKDATEQIVKNKELSFFYLPTSTTGIVVSHDNYSLSYSEKHEQPEWVAYELKKEHLVKNEFKRPFFEVDNKVRSSSADWRNYKNSGYDRGHLCPAGDRGFSYDAFEETFLTSNVSPQNHEFNAGVWNYLEQKVRYWASKYDGVYVITGGVLTDDLKTIGYEAVSVPKYFYKVILNKNSKNSKMIAFLIPHEDSDRPLEDFVVTTDSIEKLTGIDFFQELPDTIENKLEASSNKNGWKF
ncbi:DNA/RNA non-specific endonuclease [Aquimarina sp. BL5]|uniref:DNA/RNA non-specific endonuclease n=1 Tax=Aquimarina sp. BL5 TaxID=1714860 RepID=UPI000E493E2E|nr:DNA/RNA non-specific endonuclease [Aquimarina sp. BL5]AXT51516.1 DNA/RNA non-specific endonuclease [Aquimarina sp. BL5]RKN06915.1 DNA/RNA non-specific endonuclease [Aquimarina sp. BL5]